MDILFLTAAFLFSLYLRDSAFEHYWLGPIFITAHFFLFCNVIRPGPAREVAWIAWLFIAVSIVRTAGLSFPTDWYYIVLCATAMLIILSLKSPNYYGIGYRYFEKRRGTIAKVNSKYF